jgi:hypothetical protein
MSIGGFFILVVLIIKKQPSPGTKSIELFAITVDFIKWRQTDQYHQVQVTIYLLGQVQVRIPELIFILRKLNMIALTQMITFSVITLSDFHCVIELTFNRIDSDFKGRILFYLLIENKWNFLQFYFNRFDHDSIRENLKSQSLNTNMAVVQRLVQNTN